MSDSKPHQDSLFPDAFEDVMPWEEAQERDRVVAQIAFPRPVDRVFDYWLPDSLRDRLQAGQRVRAPFGRGNRLTIGFCVGLDRCQDPQRRLKVVSEILDERPLLDDRMLKLTRWIADYQLCSWGQVLESVVPAGVKKQAGTRMMTVYEAVPDARERAAARRLTHKQSALLELLLAANEPLMVDELTRAAGCGTGPLHALRDKGLVRPQRERRSRFELDQEPVERIADLELNSRQQQALAVITEQLQAGTHSTILLHGVTGSGKTEVYIQAIREVVSFGRQAIVLVPEISLTPQTIRRFRSRFDHIAVLHSHLSDAERHWHWQEIATGRVQVIVGARSAVFAPTPHLGLIVIDEEHETTFKQDSVPRYHAREVARRRSELEQIPLILGSATPTLEAWHQVHTERIRLVSLPDRVANLPLPPVHIVDVRNDPEIGKGASIGRALGNAMRQALSDEGQIILFLNLRGYSPTMWCHACGTTVRCPHCDVSLTWHRDKGRVLCHSCEYAAEPPRQCPQCQSPSVRFFGTGTQRLEQEVRSRFPETSCLRMDSDTMRLPGSHAEALERFRQGEVRVLLGTQMIAKGLDFPNVTLVGVINADTILHQPDLRASERTFQLLAQVAGRTGRSQRGGRVLVQTSNPDDPAVQLAARHDYQSFATYELKNRRQMDAPPYSHYVRVVVRGEREEVVRQQAGEITQLVRSAAEQQELPVRVLGPAPAPVTRLKGLFRYHLQLVTVDLAALQRMWRELEPAVNRIAGIEFMIDVDPINMR